MDLISIENNQENNALENHIQQILCKYPECPQLVERYCIAG
jgi:hypothetical protein